MVSSTSLPKASHEWMTPLCLRVPFIGEYEMTPRVELCGLNLSLLPVDTLWPYPFMIACDTLWPYPFMFACRQHNPSRARMGPRLFRRWLDRCAESF